MRPEGATSGKVVVTTPTAGWSAIRTWDQQIGVGMVAFRNLLSAPCAHSDLETCRTITTEIGICCRVEPLVADTVTE